MKACILLAVALCFVALVSAAEIQMGDPTTEIVRIVNLGIEALDTFLGLSDTPSSYTGSGDYCVVVNTGETALEFTACNVSGGGGVESDPFFIAENASLWAEAKNTFNDSYDRYAHNQSDGFEADTNFSNCGDGEYGDGSGICLNFNDTVKSLFAGEQVVYNATSITTDVGTLDSGNITSILQFGEGDTYNVSEVSGAPGFMINVTFTNVVNFNTVAIRGMYDGGAGHTIDLELFRLSTQTWDDFGDITDQPSFGVTSFPVFIGSNFINTSVGNGTVLFRFNHDDSGNPAHNYFLDAIFIGQVTGLISGGAHDDTIGRDNCLTNHPDAICADGTIRNFTGNIKGDLGINATFDWFFGNLNWSWLQDVPTTIYNHSSVLEALYKQFWYNTSDGFEADTNLSLGGDMGGDLNIAGNLEVNNITLNGTLNLEGNNITSSGRLRFEFPATINYGELYSTADYLRFRITNSNGLLRFNSADASKVGISFDDGAHYADLEWDKTNDDFNIFTTDEIDFQTGGDESDFMRVQTVSDVPEITTIGSCDLKISSSSGLIDIEDDIIMSDTEKIYFGDTQKWIVENTASANDLDINAAQAVNFLVGGTQIGEVKSTGLNLGGTRTLGVGGMTDGATFEIHGTLPSMGQYRYTTSSATQGPGISLNKARGTQASPTVVVNGDLLGNLVNFRGYSGAASDFRSASRITGAVDGVPDSGGDTTDMPGSLLFKTSADGSASPTERMEINNAGEITMPAVYDDTNSSANVRDLWIQDDGQLVYILSSIDSKENIKEATNTDWIYDLRVVNFDYKGGIKLDQTGLIAEEVNLIEPRIVSYERNITYKEICENTTLLSGENITDCYSEVDKIITTDIPETVNYGSPILLSTMLKEIQNLREEIDELKADCLCTQP